MKARSLFSLWLAVVACALFPEHLQAQSNQGPDFSNVTDILHGNRTLLQITDLQSAFFSPGDGIVTYQLTTSNSNVTNAQTFIYAGAPLPSGGSFATSRLPSFAGWMVNQPQAVTITAWNGGSELYVLNIPNQPTSPVVLTPQPSGSKGVFTAGVMSDFNLDGYDDFALSYDDGTIEIVTAVDPNKPDAGFKVGPFAMLDSLADMTAGDFNGDGHAEIAGLSILSNGGLKLVVYSVDPGTLAITPVPTGSLVLNTKNTSPITHVSIARGKFNTRDHDQLAVAFATDSGQSTETVEIVDFAPNPLTPIEDVKNALSVSNVAVSGGWIQVKTGQFAFPNPYDQIVFHSSRPADSGSKFFEIISVDSASLALTANPPVSYDQYPASFGLAVGNFDHQQADLQNSDKTEHDPNAQIAFMSCTCAYAQPDNAFINIYSVDPTGFGLNFESGYPLSEDGYDAYLNRSIVATDIQGRSAVLGAPTKVTIDNSSPTVITAAPPMHIDYITPVGGNKPEVLNLSYIPDGFNSSYQLTQQSKTGASTTDKFSWSAGLDESVSRSYQIGDPDQGTGGRLGLAFHAAQDFTGNTEANGSNYSKTEFDVSAATRTADSVFYEASRLNIWVYPVLGQKACPALPNNAPNNCSADQQLPLTIQFSGPDQIDTGNISADLASWYQPPWEFGNVFSYPATKDQLALIYPDLAATQLSNDQTFYTDLSSKKFQANWSSASTTGSAASTTKNFSFSLEETGVISVGVGDITTAKTSESLKVSGSFGFEHLQTNTASVTKSNGLGIQAVGLFRDPPNYAYALTPVILGSPPPPAGIGDSTQPPLADIQTIGPLKTAFVADPLANSAGAWWTSAYSPAPDVALNHPSRWTLTEPALSNPIPDNCAGTGTGASQMDCADIALYMPNSEDLWVCEFCRIHGFFITSADKPGAGPQLGFATAGDKLDLGVRVYNYSLAQMPEGTVVHVRFYGMLWDTSNNTPVGDSFLIGETKLGAIPPFSDSDGAPLNWVIAHTPIPFDTTPYSGKSLVFWVVVWMQDANGNLVKEIEGHGLTSVPGTLRSLADVPVEMAKDTQGNPASFSNNVGLYHSVFYVQPPPNELAALPPSNPAEITLARVFAAKEQIRPGEVDIITALLKAGPAGAAGLKVYFYDGDPGNGGKLIALETASVQGNSTTQVRIPYYAATDGVHQIWALVNKSKPYQTEGRTDAITVKWSKS